MELYSLRHFDMLHCGFEFALLLFVCLWRVAREAYKERKKAKQYRLRMHYTALFRLLRYTTSSFAYSGRPYTSE